MKKREMKHLKNINILSILFLSFFLFVYKIKMPTFSLSYFFFFVFLFLILIVEFINIVYQIPFLLKNFYSFLWKMSFVFFLFFVFYNFILLKNKSDLESILFCLLSFCPIILKTIVSLSLYIKFYILKKKYHITDINIFTKIINTKRFVIKKEDRYKEKVKIKKIFSSNKMTKKLDSSLRTAILVFNKNKLDKRIIKSFKLESTTFPSLKKSFHQASYKKKVYIKGSVPTLLSNCKYYMKNNRRYKLNKSSYQYILNSYHKALFSCDKIIGYASCKEEEKEMIFLGFFGFNYVYKEGFSHLKKQVILTEKKTSVYDVNLKDLEKSIYTKGKKDLKHLVGLIGEVKEYYHHLKLAFLYYCSSKMILFLFVFLSFYIMIPIFTIENLLFLEFIIHPLLFLEISLFEGNMKSTTISWHLLFTILSLLFHFSLFSFLYPHFCITSLRSILFFSYLLQQIFGVYHFLLEPYQKIRKNKYVNAFFCFFLFLFLFIFKTKFLSLPFYSFLFVLFTNSSFFFFLEIIKNIKK